MKINLLRTELDQAISNVYNAVAKKASIPALEGILIKAYGEYITITAYNLDIAITTKIEATIMEEGEFVVKADIMNNIVKRLPEEVVCIETDERMVIYITSGNADYQIVGMTPNEYPDIPSFEEVHTFEINSDLLKNMIKQTIYAVSENNQKPIYTGSLFEITENSLKIVAVDGFRMAIRTEAISSDINTKFVVPGKTQSEILKLPNNQDNISIAVGMRYIKFKIDNYTIFSRLLEGTFLDYNSTLPKEKKTEVVVNTRTIINSVDRMSFLNADKIKSPLKCEFSNDEIKFSCSSVLGKAHDEIKVPIVGEDVVIGFNNRFLLEALKNVDSDEVRIVINGSISPMVITPVKSDNFINIVVPMRLANE